MSPALLVITDRDASDFLGGNGKTLLTLEQGALVADLQAAFFIAFDVHCGLQYGQQTPKLIDHHTSTFYVDRTVGC